jgi:hypothetical protein
LAVREWFFEREAGGCQDGVSDGLCFHFTSMDWIVDWSSGELEDCRYINGANYTGSDVTSSWKRNEEGEKESELMYKKEPMKETQAKAN